MKKNLVLLFLFFCVINSTNAQPDRWQQRIKYAIDVNMNVAKNQLTGNEKIDYWNNSPDTLNRIFFHLYWNAFQPNSMMDERSREMGKILIGTKDGKDIYGWNEKVKDRISKLQPNEIGYDSVKYIKINGVLQKLIYHETILEVKLSSPILPHSKTSLDMAFNAQVSLQIRRSGRDNREGIRYSMSQWYPKMVEYDYKGWNANPYIAGEFYGVWGDYDVNITIDKSYMLAGTGTIINANEVGFGYEKSAMSNQQSAVSKLSTTTNNQSSTTLTWKFDAQNVHDFMWAADPTFTMLKQQIKNGPLVYVVFKNVDSLKIKWQHLLDTAVLCYPYMAKTYGVYPYKNYSFIQGGDGGMEYPMATLIRGPGCDGAIHEWTHSWYQGMLGTNESLYPWMDEGFTTYTATRTLAWARGRSTVVAFKDFYDNYFRLAKSPREEPLSTHADVYNSYFAYAYSSYYKGGIFLSQLGYIVGDSVRDKILLEYYNEWRFKHPNPNDFIRIAEKLSGIELQWYEEYWINSTKTIDYALGNINDSDGKAAVTLKRIGYIPMPVDVLVTYKDSTKEMYYVPMNLMYGTKNSEDKNIPFITEPEWQWTAPDYTLLLNKSVGDIKEIEIDPSMRMADINRANNKITVPE
jgi:hypothetical protein